MTEKRNMEFEKFKHTLLDSKWDAFFDFADTVNLAVGENVYHTCNFCPYHTKHVLNLSYTDDIDEQIAKHLFKETSCSDHELPCFPDRQCKGASTS